MAVVAATALVICGYRLLFDTDGRRIAATFLLYISVLSTASPSAGMRALRDKGRFFEHLSSMIGSSIGALTAFLVVNAPRFGLVTTSLVLWIAPSLAGLAAIVIWSRHYRQRFAAGNAAPARAA
jgi:hypothetical protein